MITEAIVLAGGFGTRLQSVVNDLPKPMAPVAGKPFLSYVLDYLANQGITHAVLSVGYRHEAIIRHFGNEYKNISLTYAIEKEPLGTGGAIKFAMQFIENEDFAVLNGDTIFKIDFSEFYRYHKHAQADLSIALRLVEDVSRYGTVLTKDKGRISDFLEKGQKAGAGKINGGIYLLNKSIIEKIANFTGNFSMEKDVFERYYATYSFYGFAFNEYFIDIGIPEDYHRAQVELNLT